MLSGRDYNDAAARLESGGMSVSFIKFLSEPAQITRAVFPVSWPDAGKAPVTVYWGAPVSPWARKGLVTILRSKIVARPCNLDCSGNPGFCRREAAKMRPNSPSEKFLIPHS
jgi:hypothetical protein